MTTHIFAENVSTTIIADVKTVTTLFMTITYVGTTICTTAVVVMMILMMMTKLRTTAIPDTKIETDSYIAVQLIEKENIVDSNSIKAMAESVLGSFVFTVLRDDNTLFLIKGDNPITLLHYPELGLYVYASTTTILTTALKAVKFTASCEEVPVNDGDIVRIDSDGKLTVSTFEECVPKYNYRHWFSWYDYEFEKSEEEYTNDLLMICGCYGVDKEDVELLLELGYSSDEIEEMLLDSELFEQTMEEVKTLY